NLELPKHATGKVIGTGGKQIAEIRQTSGAQVDVDKSGDFCRVRVMGPRESVEKAKRLIAAIMDPPSAAPAVGQGQATPGFFMQLPRNAVGRLIGAGGARITELQEKSACKIDVDRSTEPPTVRFSGTPESIEV
ncbi:unnamed protein product, partial [Prorocentrum cordatum]